MDKDVEKEAVRSNRDLLAERMKERYPDQEYEDDDGLFGAAMGDLSSYEERLSKQDEVDNQLTEMFSKDANMASHFMDLMAGKNPLLSMIEKYGPQLRDALEDPAIAEELAEANTSYVDRLGKEKELEEAYEANIAKSIEEANALEEAGTYTSEQIDEAFQAILDDANRAIMGEVSAEMLEMRLKGANYDQDVEGAASEAEVRGKNEAIELKKKDLKNEIPMIDGNRAEVAPKKRNPTIDSLDSMTSGGDMWKGMQKRKI